MTDRSLDVLIDEVALGLAEPAEIDRIEALAAADPVIAARLDQARQQFLALDDTADPQPLPADFWSRIAARLDAPYADATPDASPDASPDAPPAARAEGAQASVIDLASARRALTRWRVTALAGLAATLALGLSLAWLALSQPAPMVIAVLLNDAGEAIALVESRADNTTRITLLEPQSVAPDQVMQVWTKPTEDGPPVSLGLRAAGRSDTLSVQGLPSPRPQQLYEITFEPAGGAPTQRPTGPILGKGLAREPVT
jgi:anti-sigma-K factor RskA